MILPIFKPFASLATPKPVLADPEGAVSISTAFQPDIAQGFYTRHSRFQKNKISQQTQYLSHF
jgi:hypothetical protein